MARKLLFKVTTRSTGHEYKIFANGEVEGFGNGALIFNYFPILAREIEVSALGRQNSRRTYESRPKGLATRTERRRK
jgi:hypothetical protein